MDKLKKYKYIKGDTLEPGEYYCMFDKQTIAFKSGKFIEKQDDFIILQSKVNRYHLSSDDHYIIVDDMNLILPLSIEKLY